MRSVRSIKLRNEAVRWKNDRPVDFSRLPIHDDPSGNAIPEVCVIRRSTGPPGNPHEADTDTTHTFRIN